MSDAKNWLLFIDDEPSVRRAAATLLRASGYEVDDAANGTQALDLLRQKKYALVLLDLVMPGTDSWGLVRRVSALPEGPPVVLTANEDEDIGEGIVTPRVLGYVKKPFAAGYMLETCANAIADATRPPNPAAERRHEERRTFHLGGELLSPSGVGLARGELVDLSRDGFQVRAELPLAVGDLVAFAFRVPGQAQSLPLRGRILRREGDRMGVKLEPPARAHFDILTALRGPE